MLDIALVGPPAVGKGVQRGLLKQKIPHALALEMSALLKARAAVGDGIGKMIKGCMDNDVMVPDTVTSEVYFRALYTNIGDSSIVIGDGFPRTKGQGSALKEHDDIRKIVIVYLRAHQGDIRGDKEVNGVLVSRMVNGRPDRPTGESHAYKRIHIFADEVPQLLEQAQHDSVNGETGRVHFVPVDVMNRKPEDIHNEIMHQLRELSLVR
jgi:hypothetical protein